MKEDLLENEEFLLPIAPEKVIDPAKPVARGKSADDIITYWCEGCGGPILFETDILYCRVRVCRSPDCIRKIIMEDPYRFYMEVL